MAVVQEHFVYLKYAAPDQGITANKLQTPRQTSGDVKTWVGRILVTTAVATAVATTTGKFDGDQMLKKDDVRRNIDCV